MAKRIFVLGFALAGLAVQAHAAEQYPSINFSFDGSLPLQYETNPTRSETKKQPDSIFSPYFRLSAYGDLRPDISYSFYAATSVDRYLQEQDNTGSTIAFGGQVTKKWGPLQLGAVYDRNYGYDQDYRTLNSINNDFGVFLRYHYSNAAADFRIRPGIAITARLDEFFTLQRNLYNFKIDFEKKLLDRWWLILTPRVRFYDYSDTQAGRQDLIASISTGIKYEINQDMNFTTTIGYESRRSNTPDKNYKNLFVGASLDFSFTLPGSDKKSQFLR